MNSLQRIPKIGISFLTLFLYVTMLMILDVAAEYRPIATNVYVDPPFGTYYRLSADGNTIFFLRSDEENIDNKALYAASLTDGRLIRLDTEGYVRDFDITETAVYYVHTEPTFTQGRLVRVPLPDKEQESRLVLAEGSQLTSIGSWYGGSDTLLTSDNAHVLFLQTVDFINHRYGLFSVSVNGGTPVRLDSDRFPLASTMRSDKNSRYVAYMSSENYRESVVVVPVEGITPTVVSPSGVDATGYALGDEDQTEMIVQGLEGVDGDASLHLYRVPLTGGEAITLTSGYTFTYLAPFATPPGFERALMATNRNPNNPGSVQLLSFPFNGDPPTSLLTITGSYIGNFVFPPAPHSDQVIVCVQGQGFYSLPWDGSAPAISISGATTCHPQKMAFSDQGRYFYYNAGATLYRTPIDGSSAPTPLSHVVSDWYLNENSNRIYLVTTRDAQTQVEVISTIGGESQLLYNVPEDENATLITDAAVALTDTILFRTFNVTNPKVGTLFLAGDIVATAQFNIAERLVAETDGIYTSTITLSAASLTTITAQIDITGGTATAGEDYTFTPLTITFAPGEMSAPVPITLLEDDEDEPTETLILELSNIEGGVAGTPITQTITIAEIVYRQWMPLASHQR